MTKKRIVLGVLLIVSFIVSLVFYSMNEKKYSRISFTFQNELTKEFIIEERYILIHGNYQDRAVTVLEELFLGPLSVFNRKLVPYNQKYNCFYVNGTTAFLDLPVTIIKENIGNSLEIKELFELIKKNVLRNIPKLKSMIITVDGILLGDGPPLKELPQGEIDDKKL